MFMILFEIESHVVEYFSSLYSQQSSHMDNGLIERVIPYLVSPSDNLMLTSIPSFEEIKSIVFSMKNNSAPGPDGFDCCFYQIYWDIVGENV